MKTFYLFTEGAVYCFFLFHQSKIIKSLNHQPQRYFWFFNKYGGFQNDFDTFKLTTEKEEPNLNYKFNNNLPLVKLNAICEEIINDLNRKELFNRAK